MPHGKNISVNFAKKSIKRFADQEVLRTNKPEDQVVVGHKLDLSLVKTFLKHIEELNNSGADIDSIRIYLGINNREVAGSAENYDVILVPVHATDKDFHTVYKSLTDDVIQPTLLGKSTPCPNVCEQKYLSANCEPV